MSRKFLIVRTRMTITEPTWTHFRDDTWNYIAPCHFNGEDLPWTNHLGKVRKRKDGRFDWWRLPGSKDWPTKGWTCDKIVQGVASTLEEAGTKVEEGWNTP